DVMSEMQVKTFCLGCQALFCKSRCAVYRFALAPHPAEATRKKTSGSVQVPGGLGTYAASGRFGAGISKTKPQRPWLQRVSCVPPRRANRVSLAPLWQRAENHDRGSATRTSHLLQKPPTRDRRKVVPGSRPPTRV